ncbi:universal stress protein [Nocardia huaxiensis]|uniref:Universal stress protein n=1 Tax=Nocardia huaxiensis TaxID=2755382 RepID=A0A7D6ZTX0_9NOCA|nr:universal stress protein [Nocardia huaxiensis]QLY28569.1 universal stress protein [Nocardia huaxiensis]UFS97963.1 universal stress protein [Nocardia huaxiensis]
MSEILVRPSPPASAIAGALGAVLAAESRVLAATVSDAEFLLALNDPGVLLGVAELDGGWRIVEQASKPVVFVRADTRLHSVIDQVLVPLDGTTETANAVAETVRLFRAAGVEIIVLHVFDSATTPSYWDQAAHARAEWQEEFVSRYCAPYFDTVPPEVTLCSGGPGENVVEVADKSADLIILGWSRTLLPGRARTVRTALAEASVPVMLVPTVTT